MLSTGTKIYVIMLITAVVLCIFFGFMWQNSSKNLRTTKEDLITANLTIQGLQNDMNKLSQYIIEKDNKIKDLENKYKAKMNNIPADKCGDTKPSKELLEYFRKGAE